MVSDFVIDITEENIQAELLDKSMDVPILIDVWADWCEPCKALSPILERLVGEYQGRFILAKINADEQQSIVAQLQVKSLPTLKLITQGQIVGELIGAQPESAIRALLDPHLGEPDSLAVDNIEAVLEEVEALCGGGQLEQAMTLLKAIIYLEAIEPDKISSWLFKVALNSYKDLCRKNKKLPLSLLESEDILNNMSAVDYLPENYVLNGEKKKQVVQVLDKLSPIYKNLLVLKYALELSYREIAEVLDINEKTVKTYIYRAKRKFKNIWKELNYER